MIRAARKHGLERLHLLRGAALGRRPVGLPIVPRLQVHERVGEQQLDLVVIGVVGRQRRQGVGIGCIQRLAVGSGIGRVPLGHRCDQRLLLGRDAAGQRLGLGHRGEGGCDGLGQHRQIDVGAEHISLAPVAHGAGRILALCCPERPRRLGVVEGVGEPQALIEVGLRLRAPGRDLPGQRAEIGIELGLGGRGDARGRSGDQLEARLEHLRLPLRRRQAHVACHVSRIARRLEPIIVFPKVIFLADR